MLGIVFTEFMEMVEERFSPETLERIIDKAAPANQGAYTAVGYYPHEEIVALVGALAEQTGMSAGTLVQAFGEHLFGRFTEGYASLIDGRRGTIDLLCQLDGDIHVAVRKLYPEARLPRFHVVSQGDGELRLAYESPRGMEDLALGLIKGAIRHFGEPLQVHWEHGTFEGRAVSVFHVRPRP
ncbi:heme NO-binding domain-containing protein [Silanimonas algicola]